MRGALLFALLAAVLAAQTSEPETRGSIQGSVKDSNGLPVPGVTVEAYQSGGEPQFIRVANGGVGMSARPAKAVTDEAGKYALPNLAPSTYSIRTDRDPESSTYRRIKVDAGQEAALDIVIPAKPTISGHVLDENGDRIPGASVWLIRPEYTSGILEHTLIGPKTTDEKGSFSFDSNLESNRRYYVRVDRDVPKELDLETRPPIEVPTYYPSAAIMDLATPVILQPGERRDLEIKVAMAQVFCAAGKISGGADFEIREAALTGTRLVRLRDRPDQHGNYRVCGLSPGEYRLSGFQGATDFTVLGSDLEHVDLSTNVAHLRVKAEWDDPSNAPTTPKLGDRAEAALRKIATALDIHEPTVDDLISLGARIVRDDPADRALSDALARNPYERGYLTGTFSLGDFLLHVALNGVTAVTAFPVAVPSDAAFGIHLPAGDYAIEFQTLGKNNTYPKEITYNDVKITDGILRLAPESNGTLQLVMATDVSTLAVSVKDALDNPVPGGSVVLIPDSVTTAPALSRLAVRGQADQNGHYNSPSVAPGKYRVLATTNTIRWNVPEDLDKLLLAALQAKTVEVPPKAKTEVAVELSPVY